jgi:hypothetical protein
MMYLYLKIAVILMLLLFNGCTSPVEITDIDEIEIDGYVWSYLGLEGKWVTSVEDTPWGLFAGTHLHGVFRYDENRNRWISLGLEHAAISEIAYASTDKPKVFVAVRVGQGESETIPAVLYASKDGGNTWLEWDGGIAKQHDGYFSAWSLLVDDRNPERMYFGASWYQLLYSENGGKSWDYISGDQSTWGGITYAIALSPERDGRMWFGGTTAFGYPIIGRSDEWGRDAEIIYRARFETAVRKIVVDKEDANRFWWAEQAGGVAISEDGGDSWRPSLTPALDPDPDQVVFTGLVQIEDLLYAAGGRNPETPSGVYELRLYKSSDKGISWTKLSTPENAILAWDLKCDLQKGLLIPTSNGLWRVEPK